MSERSTIDVSVKESQNVRIEVFDILGRRVKTIRESERLDPNQTYQFTIEVGGVADRPCLIGAVGESFQTVRKVVLR